MSKSKKKYHPKSFESTGASNDTSANIYRSMLLSAAFLSLSKNQRYLYICMKDQYYGTRKPGQDYEDIEKYQGDDKFYFNMALAEKYGIYKRSNRRAFYDDIKELCNHGLIRRITDGKTTKCRSIYQFSGDWKTWRDSDCNLKPL